MRKSSYARSLFFLQRANAQPPAFIDTLARAIELPIPAITTETLMRTDPLHRNRILLIDYQEHKVLLLQIRNLPLICKNFETIIFNVPKRLSTDELLGFGQSKAVFYADCSMEKIAEGVIAVIEGQNWLPRHVQAQLLHYYRNMFNTHTAPANVDLTIREIQVLRCLQAGASNAHIAEDLFISEYTVKSHLYQIFKKLSVKNRLQATAWADQHLLS